MTTTPSHKNVYVALMEAQKVMRPAKKDSKNPHFNSMYADLSDVVEAVRPALNENGIVFFHIPLADDIGMRMKTVLYHGETGTSIECEVPLMVEKNNMQGYKSATTYAKRIGLESITGVAPEDDDGNDAAGVPPRQPAYKPRGEVTDPARKAQLAQQARAQQNTPPQTERPHEPADSRADPEATRAAGDDSSEPGFFDDVKEAAAREWTPEAVEARGKEIATALRDPSNNVEGLDGLWSLYSDEIATMPGNAQKGLRRVYDDQREAIEAGQ